MEGVVFIVFVVMELVLSKLWTMRCNETLF